MGEKSDLTRFDNKQLRMYNIHVFDTAITQQITCSESILEKGLKPNIGPRPQFQLRKKRRRCVGRKMCGKVSLQCKCEALNVFQFNGSYEK